MRTDAFHNRNFVFSKEIDVDTKISDQHHSGRCWLFSFTNMLRIRMVRKYKLDAAFQLSTNYLFFWDQLEKANVFLHNIWMLRDHDVKSYYNRMLLQTPVEDGGDWNIVKNLVAKYGLVPTTAMYDSYQSRNTETYSRLLNSRLRTFAMELREADAEALPETRIREMLGEVYRILCITMGGPPPKRFRWEYYVEEDDEKKKKKKKERRKRRRAQRQPRRRRLHHVPHENEEEHASTCENEVSENASEAWQAQAQSTAGGAHADADADADVDADADADEEGAQQHAHAAETKKKKKKKPAHKMYRQTHTMTPTTFFQRYITNEYLNGFISMIHHPDNPPWRWISIKFNDAMVGGNPNRMLNVPIDELKRSAMASIDRGYPVFFSCDVAKDGSSKEGVLDSDAFDRQSIFGFEPFSLSRRDRLLLRDGEPTHAMVLRGYHLRRRTSGSARDRASKMPSRWLVENSWGEEAGKDGRFVMSNAWFDKHVYGISTHVRANDPRLRDADRLPPIVLEPHDIFGSLASFK